MQDSSFFHVILTVELDYFVIDVDEVALFEVGIIVSWLVFVFGVFGRDADCLNPLISIKTLILTFAAIIKLEYLLCQS